MTASTLPIWRSSLFVPVNVERFVAKALDRGADALLLDLEDSVAPADKVDARKLLPGIVERLHRQDRADLIVRINQPLELAVRDLEAAIVPGVKGILVTKVEGTDHLRLLDELVSRLEEARGIAPGTVTFIPLIESPGPLARAIEIGGASRRVVALALGGEDYATSVGAEPAPETLLLPSQQILQAARAQRVLPLGTLCSVADYTNLDTYTRIVKQSATFGFVGAFAIHPAQIPILNAGFSPAPEAVELAEKIVRLDKEAAAANRGSWSLDGKMIDIPVVNRARDLLERARVIADLDARKKS